MLTKCDSYLDENILAWQLANIERMEAECGCELLEFSDPTLRQRAQRLLDCPVGFEDDEDEFLNSLADE